MAKSDTASLLATLKSEYHTEVEDKTNNTVSLGDVLGAIVGALDYLVGTGSLVRDALHGYSLNTIVLYEGNEITNGPYEGAMADYELDEARMYVAAGRVTETGALTLGVGEHNVGKDFRTVFAHEIGHLIMPAFEAAIGEKFRITYDMHPSIYWQTAISEYAGTDDHECFSEAFAAWTHADYGRDGHVLPAILETLFTEAGIESGPMLKLAKAKRKPTDVMLEDGTIVSASTITGILDAVDDADWFEIEGVISPALLSAFEDAGYAELTTAGVGADTVMVGKVSEGAKAYAESHSADLVSGLTDTTRDHLRGTIEDAVEEGWSKEELAEEIGNSFAFGEVRSELIARNELGLAYSKGRQDSAESAGATGKRSLLSADHDDMENCDCSDAADAGVVDMDESFTDDPDYDFPPYHVNCQCDWVGVYGDEEGEDEDDEDDTEKFMKGGPGSGPHPGSRRDDRDKLVHHANEARRDSRKTKDENAKELTNYAWDSTHVTGMIDSKGLHTTAAKDHLLAAEAHDKAGNAKVAESHRAAAEMHTHLAATKQNANKFVKSDEMEGIIPTEYVEAELSDEDTKANDAVQAQSSKALVLAGPDDIVGQRISGRANRFTREAATNYENARSRAADHHIAYDVHSQAAKHYTNDSPNAKAAEAHIRTAALHLKIHDRLLAEVAKLAKYNEDQPRAANGQFGSGGESKQGSFGYKEIVAATREKGGVSYQPITHDAPKPGDEAYMVSPYPGRESVIDIDSLTAENLNDFVTSNSDLLASPDHYVGTWYDKDGTGKVFLDVSVKASTPEAAEHMAMSHNQIAYFSFKDMQAHDVQSHLREERTHGKSDATYFDERGSSDETGERDSLVRKTEGTQDDDGGNRKVETASSRSGTDELEKYDPDQPRNEKGEWGTTGTTYTNKDGVWRDGKGKVAPKDIQDRLKAAGTPPGWTQVRLNPDKKGEVQSQGRDAKGRLQSRYSAEHSAAASAEKFARVRDFNEVAPRVRDQAYKDMSNKSLSQSQRDTAAATALIANTGFRVGSNWDTGAEKQAYGATNMLGSHVKVDGDNMRFNFTGKKGVEQDHELTDKRLANYISQRQSENGKGPIFSTSDTSVRNYVKSIAGDEFKVKDFRTWVGTATALNEIKGMPKPASASAYKESRNHVGDVVAAKLGNTRTVALASYIDKTAFAAWGMKYAK